MSSCCNIGEALQEAVWDRYPIPLFPRCLVEHRKLPHRDTRQSLAKRDLESSDTEKLIFVEVKNNHRTAIRLRPTARKHNVQSTVFSCACNLLNSKHLRCKIS